MTVNWDTIIKSDRDGVVRFAVGELSLRNFMDGLSDYDAYHEVRTKLERGVGAQYGRRLARKALRYRGILV